MMAKHNEAAVYETVKAGVLEIDPEGRIWRTATRGGDRWTGGARLNKCQRRRAENGTGDGSYLQVRAMIEKVRLHVLAHRLVWFHIHGEIPHGLTINHKNGLKSDNRPENLELVTYQQNSIHAVHTLQVGITLRQWGESNVSVKLTTAQAEEIKRRRSAGEKLNALAAEFGVTFQTISRIARGERRRFG